MTETFVKQRPLPAEHGATGATIGGVAGSGYGPVTVDDAAVFFGRLESGAVAAFEATRFALGRKNAMRFEINGSQGSLAFDFEDMNVLEHYDGRRPAGEAGFTRILVTEPTHPYLSSWWPPGHGLGYEHGFTHQVIDLVRGDSRPANPRGRRSPTVCTCNACWPRSRRARTPTAAGNPSPTSRSTDMARPITLFTGQWADLPFEEVARLASEWGYEGLEIACWGDHLDVWQGAEDDDYIAGRREILDRYGLQVFAISNHLTGQAVCDDPIDSRHRDILPDRVWGDGDPEGVRQRAAEG